MPGAEKLADASFALLQQLARSPQSPDETLDQLASRLGVSTPYLSQRMARLERQGWVERTERRLATGRTVRFTVRPGVVIRWVAPDEGIAIEWTAVGPVPWDFPLTTQVPDELARATVLELLRRLRRHKLLDAGDALAQDMAVVGAAIKEHRGLSLVVYGSAARGTARPGSDVDVLIVHASGMPGPIVPELRNIATKVSLQSPRPLQCRDLHVSQWDTIPPQILQDVRQTGAVVYDGLRTKPKGESYGIWRRVYGGRPLDRR